MVASGGTLPGRRERAERTMLVTISTATASQKTPHTAPQTGPPLPAS
jgi:hypothetical protein